MTRHIGKLMAASALAVLLTACASTPPVPQSPTPEQIAAAAAAEIEEARRLEEERSAFRAALSERKARDYERLVNDPGKNHQRGRAAVDAARRFGEIIPRLEDCIGAVCKIPYDKDRVYVLYTAAGEPPESRPDGSYSVGDGTAQTSVISLMRGDKIVGINAPPGQLWKIETGKFGRGAFPTYTVNVTPKFPGLTSTLIINGLTGPYRIQLRSFGVDRATQADGVASHHAGLDFYAPGTALNEEIEAQDRVDRMVERVNGLGE